MAKHLLSNRRVRNAKPRTKSYRLFDGHGLALWISPTGARSWQLRYRLDGTEQTATLGKLERLTLSQARVAADAARNLVAKGEHPTAVKHAAKVKRRSDAANTFGTFAAAWIAREGRRMQWTPNYRGEVEASLRNHLSALDRQPLTKITAATIAPILISVEKSAPHVVEKLLRRLRAIFDHAIEQGILAGNPLPAMRRRRKVERRHFPAVVDLTELGSILRAANAADPCRGVARAHVLLAFAAQRVSEVVGAQWTEFELDGVDVLIDDSQRTKRDPSAGNWSIPRGRMKRKDKTRGPHVLPLPPALLGALREWRKVDSADALFVCAAPRDPSRPVTPEAVEKFYRRTLGLGGKHSPHSWRSSFSTVARENGKDGDSIEAQLDHIVGSQVAAAYDRSKRLELRRELMRWYEQELVTARDGAK